MRCLTMLVAAGLPFLPARLDAQATSIGCGGLDRGYQAWIESGATMSQDGYGRAVAEPFSRPPG